MRRTSLLMATVLIVGMLVAPAAAVAQDETNDSDAEVTPGERLSGVVGVQNAEITGEVERTAFTIALDRADDNASKAGQIAEKLNETEERLATLEERRTELEQQRENGELTEGQYRARMATLAVEVDTVDRQVRQSETSAGELPADVLEANGVNVSAIQKLRATADELSGPEVAAIAQSIAGDERGIPDRSERGAADQSERGDADADESEHGDDARDDQDADGEDRSSQADQRGGAGSDAGDDEESTEEEPDDDEEHDDDEDADTDGEDGDDTDDGGDA